MNAYDLLSELAGKRLFATPQEKLALIERLADNTGLLPYPIPIITVTGTCGKGSTVLFLSSILESNGYRVGMIQSPHFVSFTERVQINRVPMPEKTIIDKINDLLPELYRQGQGDLQHKYGALNYNQVFLTVGLHLFLEQKVDFVIIETGIGGYNDPSSFFTPEVSIITNVHKDHEAVLGYSFEEIAYDKSGVIKKGRPVVTGAKIMEALTVIKREAGKQEAPLFTLGEQFTVNWGDEKGIYTEEDGWELSYQIRPQGDFQWENSAIALQAARILEKRGFRMSVERTRLGLSQAVLPGRFQVMKQNPLTVVDGAHNEEEIRAFCEVVKQQNRRVNYLILAFSSDKNINEMLDYFRELNAVYLFPPHSYALRQKDPTELARICVAQGLEGIAFDSLQLAYDYAKSRAAEEDGIFFTGSMFMAGDALKLFGT